MVRENGRLSRSELKKTNLSLPIQARSKHRIGNDVLYSIQEGRMYRSYNSEERVQQPLRCPPSVVGVVSAAARRKCSLSNGGRARERRVSDCAAALAAASSAVWVAARTALRALNSQR